MPVLARFFGIVITMYHREHGVAHFHAQYGEHWISVEIESGEVHGRFPASGLRHIEEWAEVHRDELLADWKLAREGRPINHIAPLE